MTAAANAPAGRDTGVLLVCDWFVRYTVGLAGGLAAGGAPVALLTRTHDREFGSAPGAMRAYVRAELGGLPHLRLGGRVSDPRAAPDLARLARRARALAPRVVHLQDSVVNDPRLLLAAGARPGRYALTVHDVERHPGDPAASPRQRALARALIRGAGLIFVHADPLREQLLALHAPRAPVVVVPHGSDDPLPAPPPARPSLLLFGRMSRYKGADTLLDALPLVWEQAPETRLVIAGKGPLEPHPVLADPRVVLRNEYVPDADVPGLFAAATCVVLPYREASQTGVGALAKRYGRGLVVTAVGGLPSVAADGSAVVVAPEDPRALAAALVDVVRTPGLAERMGHAATAAVRAELSWSRVGASTLAAYERHLPAPRRTSWKPAVSRTDAT
jgi:glycosyltransferase involved in cell wall biosynthesis